MNDDDQIHVVASGLRRTISDLLGAPHSDRIILAPGILIALRSLFSHLRVGRALLTNEEYYGPSHFPACSVHVAGCREFPRLLQERDFDALVASPVSWRGVRQPVAELFGGIRETLGDKTPLLVADCAHAGAIGFPSANGLAADIVCGDLEKWILPPNCSSRVAFLWFSSRRLYLEAAEAFRAFFLAMEGSDVALEARWVDPDDVLAASGRLAELDVTRNQLRTRHQADMKLAETLASRLDPSRVPETSILWLEDDEVGGEIVEQLDDLGLVWRLPGRGTRILCRNDVVAGGTAMWKRATG
jgi:hypothetical protein